MDVGVDGGGHARVGRLFRRGLPAQARAVRLVLALRLFKLGVRDRRERRPEVAVLLARGVQGLVR